MTIIGRVTKDAVVATLKDERKVVNFTIAVNDYYKPKGSEKGVTVTSFINCAYWVNPKIGEWLKKGNLIEVAGRLSINAYKDIQGEAKGSLNCHVNLIKVHQQMNRDAAKPSSTVKDPVDDLPF